MKKQTILAVACSIVSLVACTNLNAGATTNTGVVSNQQQSAGHWKNSEEIFLKVCANCHDTGGRVGPNIKGRGFPKDYVFQTVRAGRNAMPSFRPSDMSNQELHALGDWLNTQRPSTGNAMPKRR